MAPPAAMLVGREPELSAVGRLVAGLARGAPRVLGVSGEPGIGKSRLLAEVAGRAAEHGALVLAGRAAELERDLPFGLIADALDAPAAARVDVLAGLDGEVLAELAAVLPALGRAADVGPTAAHGERHRTARAVRSVLERLAGERPVALVLDDVHWADPPSADALALVLHRPPAAPVLMALAARTGAAPGLEAALAQAARTGTAELLELGPLRADAADVLMPGVGCATRERLYEETGDPASTTGVEFQSGVGVDTPTATDAADSLSALGEGRDTIDARGGDDRIATRNREADSVACGRGTDTVRTHSPNLDLQTGCEQQIEVGVLGLAPAALRAEAGGVARLTVSWRHPRAWRQVRRGGRQLERAAGAIRVGQLRHPSHRPRSNRRHPCPPTTTARCTASTCPSSTAASSSRMPASRPS